METTYTTELSTGDAKLAFDQSIDYDIDRDVAAENTITDTTLPKPVSVTPRVASLMNDPVAGSAIQNDIDKMSDVERMFGKFSVLKEKTFVSSDLYRGSFNLMTYDNGAGILSSINDDIKREELVNTLVEKEQELKPLSVYDRPDDFSIDILPGATGVLFQMYDAIVENPKIAAVSTATGGAAGAFVGGPAGAAMGALGTTLATTSGKDNFEITAGQIYYDAYLNAPDDERAKLNAEEVMHIALGAGAISGSLEFIGGGLLAKTGKEAAEKSVLKKVTSKQVVSLIKKGIGKSEVLTALKGIGKVFATQLKEQGVVEGFQTLTEQTAKAVAKPGDLTSQQFLDQFDIKEIIKSTIIGGVAGSATNVIGQGTGMLIEANKGKDAPDPMKTVPKTPEMIQFEMNLDQRILEAETFKSDIEAINDIVQSSSIKETEALDFTLDEIIPESARFYLNKDAIQKMEETRQGFYDAFQKITKTELNEDNDIYGVSGKELLKLYTQDDRVLDYIQQRPDADSLISLKAIEKKWQNQTKVNELLDQLQVVNLSEEDQANVRKNINELITQTIDGAFDKTSFILKPVIDERLKQDLGAKGIEEFENAVIDVRAEIADQLLQKEKDREFNAISLDVRTEMDSVVEEINKEIADNKNFNVEDALDPSQQLNDKLIAVLRNTDPNFKDLSDEVIRTNIRAKHKRKKAVSLIAIDPTTLPENLKSIAKDPRARKKGAFVKGGLDWKHAKAVASALGFQGNNNDIALLRNISQQETKQEYYERRYDEQLRSQFEKSEADLASTKDDMIKAFDQDAKNDLQEIKTLADKYPKEFKRIIKQLGRNIRPFSRLKTTSIFLTYSLKVKDLVPLIFKVNQDRFAAKAADSVIKENWFDFWASKEKQALNRLIEGNVTKLRKVIEGRVAYIKRLNTKEQRAILYKAGPEYVEAFDAVKNLVSGKPFKSDDLNKVLSIVRQYTDHGVEVPVALIKMVDRATKVQQGDLSVSELMAVLNTIINIHSIAKKVAVINLDQEVLQNVELENMIATELTGRSGYDPEQYDKLTITESEQTSTWEYIIKGKDALATLHTSILNLYNIVENGLDKGFANAFFGKLFRNPIVEGLRLKNDYDKTFSEYEINIIKDGIGIENFNKMNNETVDVPFDVFKNKKATKFEVAYMMGLFGSESGRERVMKFLNTTDENALLTFFEKTLTKEDVRYVQDIHKYFRNVDLPRLQARAERLGAVRPEPVIGKSYKIHGTEFLGGYWPIRTKQDIQRQTLASVKDWVNVLKDGGNISRLHSLDLNTMDGSELSRVKDANSPLILDYGALVSAVKEKNHHHALSEPMVNISKILANRTNQRHLINTLGYSKFAALLGTIQNVANSQQDYDVIVQAHFDSINEAIFKTVNKSLHTRYMGFGIKTLLNQGLSLPSMINSLAQQLKGGLIQADAVAMWSIMKPAFASLLDRKNFKKTIKAIAEVDPQFKSYLTAMGAKDGPGFFKWMFDLEDILDVRPKGQGDFMYWVNRVQDASLKHIAAAQLLINTTMWTAAYTQAMNGNVIGIDRGNSNDAITFASTIVSKTLSDVSGLDKSPFQRTAMGRALFIFQGQLNLQSNEFIGGFKKLGLEIESEHRVTAKGAMGAFQTIIANSIAPVAMTMFAGSLLKWAMKDEEETEQTFLEKAKAMLLKLGAANFSSYPFTRTIGYMINSVEEFGVRPENLQASNPFVDLTVDSARLVVTFLTNLFGDKTEWTQERAKDGINVLTRVIGFPGVNVPPTPMDPKGQALLNKVVDWGVSQMELPSRREFLGKPSYSTPGTSLEMDELIDLYKEDPKDLSLENAKPAPQTNNQFNSQVFNDAVEQLKRPDLEPAQRSFFEQTRDIAYSVNGYTNPEGNTITTTKGEVTLSDYDREYLTTAVDAIARFETGDYSDFESESGAKGFFHFTDSTWTSLKNAYPEYNLPSSPDLATKAQQYQIYWKYIGENVVHLGQLNQVKNFTNLYLIHMMGYSDFKTFSEAQGDLDLTNVLPTQFRWNGGVMAGRTREQIVIDMDRRLAPHINNAAAFLESQNLLTLD